MKHVDEYRDAELAERLSQAIHAETQHDWTLMEVCGGQTHSIIRFGIDQLLPEAIRLIHGPGCPVCVTPLEVIDRALELAQRPEVSLCSFGDMLRVPGSSCSLVSLRARGADVRVIYSPLDAVSVAAQNPGREIVLLAIGFETTAPANAMAVLEARRRKLRNFSMLVSHVLVPPAMSALLESPDCNVQAFLAAGHVCTIMGTAEYEPLVERYRVPIVVTGFEPVDILEGILMCVRQLESGRAAVENQYRRSVRAQGNLPALDALREVFRVVPRKWRGIGPIADSGFALSPAFAEFDAELRFGVGAIQSEEPAECISGLVLRGLKRPTDCSAFGSRCNPDRPLGATMVSSEGTCAAYYRYRRPA
jgi:hydrogenase expression/formation protein HypD